jgi:hypothetical protein
VIIAVALAQPVRAEGQSLDLLVETRADAGTGDRAGLDLFVGGVGAALHIARTLELRGLGLALGPLDTTAGGVGAHGGAGGELAFQVVPFPGWPVRPYVRAAAGLLLFPRAPFLPGGDVYDFVLHYGVGVETSLGGRFRLGVHVHFVHLSNGQGLGAFNPAFDGLGGGLELAYALVGTPPASVWDGAEEPSGRETWLPGVVVEGAGGAGGGVLLVNARVRVAERLAPHLLVLVDGEAGSLDHERYGEVGLALVGHLGFASAGVHAGYRNYVGLETLVLQAQGEAHITPEVTLCATALTERSVLADVVRVGGGLRVFPVPSLLIDLGVGYDDHTRPYLGLEWQLPWRASSWAASLFLENQIASIKIVGLRVEWDVGSSLRDEARATGWRRLR